MGAWFPKSLYRAVGLALIIMGIITLALGIVGIVLAVNLNGMQFMGQFQIQILSNSLTTFCGLLAVVTGSLALASTNVLRIYRREGLKHGAAAIAILLAVFVAWTSAACSIFLGVIQMKFALTNTLGIVMVVSGACCIIIWIIALITASAFCCCSPYDSKPSKAMEAMNGGCSVQVSGGSPYVVSTPYYQ